MLLLMAGSARNGLICGQTFVVKEHPAQSRTRIRYRVRRRCVVLVYDGRDKEVRWEKRGRVIERCRRQKQSILRCVRKICPSGIKESAEKTVVRARDRPEVPMETAV